ncbi:Alpha/Beta hydrolase protein [Mycena vulgaris]|nr:Alpha/Beta hydrolase protein [Mycena vulgaris]
MFPASFLLFTAFTAVLGAPAPFSRPMARVTPATLTALTADDLTALDSFTQFARAAYCPVDKLMSWDCGAACDANPDFEATLAGGMGNAVQFFFVGYYPKSNSVIVSHQGTDPLALMSDLTDLNVFKGELNSTLFPNLPADSGIEIHTGFRDEHAITAEEIQTEVKRLIAEKGATQVTVVGHSLGGALAELDALSLRLNLPTTVGVNAVTYGTPRVGNQEFVQFFDTQVTDFKRVNNQADLVPTVPGRFLGFAHPKGEIHIVDDDTKEIVACPGNDDAEDEKCQIKTVPTILSGNILNHLGPYNGIFIGTLFCN